MSIVIWGSAALAYLAFRLWYDGLRKPLKTAEIEEFSRIVQARSGEGLDTREFATLQRFMEEDDGREFIMVNLIKLNPSPVSHPDTGEPIKAQALLAKYVRPFMGTILRRAGHPVLQARAVGGYMDQWNTPPDPGWHAAGLVRYRSRRDCILSSLANPDFQGIHKYKIAAMAQTLAFPAQVQVSLFASPRISVALVLALGAALLQLGIG